MFLDELFANFLKEEEFLNGVDPKTLGSYQPAFNACQRVLTGQAAPDKLMKFPTGTL